MRLSSMGRNDTDDFFALFLIESMDDQQNRTADYGSNGYPPLFIFRSEVALGKSIGIIENEHGRFKANIALAKVLPVFLLIPLRSQNLVATTTAYGLFLCGAGWPLPTCCCLSRACFRRAPGLGHFSAYSQCIAAVALATARMLAM